MEPYNVSFTIKDVKQMVSPDDKPVNPLVVVRCCGREYRTDIKYDKLGLVNFDCSHSWADIELSAQAFNTAVLEIELQSANAFWANTVLGVTAVQMKAVNQRQNHTLRGYLSLMGANESVTTGKINIELSILKPGDVVRVEQIKEDEGGLDETMEAAMIQSGNAQKQGVPHQLVVSLFRIEYEGASDPAMVDMAVTCEFASSTLKSTVHKATTHATMNTGFKIPVPSSTLEDTIVLGIWNERKSPPLLLARGTLSFIAVASKSIAARWFNIYGFPTEEASTFTHEDWNMIYQQDVEMTAYLGRMLLGASVQKLRTTDQIIKPEVVYAKSRGDVSPISIIYFADIYEVDVNVQQCVESRRRPLSLPAAGPQIFVKLQSGGEEVHTSPLNPTSTVEGHGVYTLNSQSGTLDPLSLHVTGTDATHPDVFVEVYTSDGSRLGYRRFASHDVPGISQDLQAATPMWVALRNPFAFYNDNLAVNVLLSLEKTKGELATRRRRRRILAAPHVLRCYIYAARHLRFLSIRDPLSEGRSSLIPSAHVEISCSGKSTSTTRATHTRFPVWLHTAEIACKLMIDANDGVPVLCPILIEVKHDKQILGHCVAGYTRLLGHKQVRTGTVERIEPLWIRLNPPHVKSTTKRDVVSTAGDSSAGHILLAIEVLRKLDAAKLAPQPIVPVLRPVQCYISLWGIKQVLATFKDNFDPLYFTNATLQQITKDRTPTVLRVVCSIQAYRKKLADGDQVATFVWSPIYHDAEGQSTSTKNVTWKDHRYSTAFTFHEVKELSASIPQNSLFDPHVVIQVFDDQDEFMGEAALSLVSLLPWINGSQLSGHIQRLAPKTSLQENPNLAVLSSAYQQAMHEMRRVTYATDQNTNAENTLVLQGDVQELSESSVALAATDVVSRKITDADEDGVPMVTKQADVLLMSRGFSVRPLKMRKKATGIVIPQGCMLATKCRLQSQTTANGRTIFNGSLDDQLPRLWPPRPLWRPLPQARGTCIRGGTMKVAVGLSVDKTISASVPSANLNTVFSTPLFRKHYAPGSHGLPEILRVRIYVLRIAAMSVPVTVTRNAVYQRPHNAVHPVTVIIRVGDERSERFTSKSNGPHPKFLVLHEADLKIPEESIVSIAAWSNDPQYGGDGVYAGETSIDLLERFLSPAFAEKVLAGETPIEIRPLRLSPDSQTSMGSLEIMVEVFKPTQSIPKMTLIEDRPVSVELRVVVWGCRGLSVPAERESVDAFVRVSLDCTDYEGSLPKDQQTDVHYGSVNGNVVYNYRMVFPDITVNPTLSSAILSIRALEFRPLGAERNIGEVNIELKNYLKNVAAQQERLSYDLELKLRDAENECVGFVQTTVQIMLSSEAKARPAGVAQELPNNDPVLVTPLAGRKWTDFLGAAGPAIPFDSLWLQVRWFTVVICFFLILFIGCIKPGIFWTMA